MAIERESLSVLDQLGSRRQVLESKLANAYFVVATLEIEDSFITPPSRFHPEGWVPTKLKASVPENLDRTKVIIDRLSGLIIPAYENQLLVIDTHVGRLNGIDSTRAIIDDLAKKGGFNGTPDIGVLDEARKLAEAEAGEVLTKGTIFFAQPNGQSAERKVESRESDELLPKMVIDEGARTVTIDGRKIEFQTGIKWELLLRLARTTYVGLSSREVEQVLRDMGSKSLPGVAIQNVRDRVELDPRDHRLIVRSGIIRDSTYHLRADVRFRTGTERQSPGLTQPSRIGALTLFNENRSATLDQIRDVLGPDKAGRLLRPQNILWTLINAVRFIYIRKVVSTASPEELGIWEQLKNVTGQSEDRDVYYTSKDMIKTWYEQHKGEYIPMPKSPKPGEGSKNNKKEAPKNGNSENQAGAREILGNPVPESRLLALSAFIDIPGLSFREIAEVLGPAKSGRPLTEWNALRSLVNSVAILRKRVEAGWATEDEVEIWDRVRSFAEADNDKVVKAFYDKLRNEYFKQQSS